MRRATPSSARLLPKSLDMLRSWTAGGTDACSPTDNPAPPFLLSCYWGYSVSEAAARRGRVRRGCCPPVVLSGNAAHQAEPAPGPRRVPADVTLDDALARVGGLQLDEGRTATEGEVGLDVVAAVRGLDAREHVGQHPGVVGEQDGHVWMLQQLGRHCARDVR